MGDVDFSITEPLCEGRATKIENGFREFEPLNLFSLFFPIFFSQLRRSCFSKSGFVSVLNHKYKINGDKKSTIKERYL